MIGKLFLVFLLFNAAQGKGHHGRGGGHGAEKPPPAVNKKWLTLNGGEPVVASTGGCGIFPDGTVNGFLFSKPLTLPGTMKYCDLQFSKDKVAFCTPNVTLQNSTNIQMLEGFQGANNTYNVNGQQIEGWFTLDFTWEQYQSEKSGVSLQQRLFQRTAAPDFLYTLSALETEEPMFQDVSNWINVEYYSFYKEHNIDAAAFLELYTQSRSVPFISSPEISLLRGLSNRIDRATTKLIFKIQELNKPEPTTGKTYRSLLKNLNVIKSFASGILVPKELIWPVDKMGYLLPAATSLVPDAHKLGLEVHVYGLQNDGYLSLNYSYNPSKEVLQFIDNPIFSVDGLITEFPVTASESIACFAHDRKPTRMIPGLVISSNGSSGDYAGSTDLAYLKAIESGADIIDCTVQFSKDGVAFCMGSVDLSWPTNAPESMMERTTSAPEIQSSDGIFSFDLTWEEIQALKPQLRSPYSKTEMPRNPLAFDKGKFLTLAEFLSLAKEKKAGGIMMILENVAYYASNKGRDMIKTVSSALSEAGFDKQSTQKVLIQSDDSKVLEQFKNTPGSYQRVFRIKPAISSVSDEEAKQIKQFADAVVVGRDSIVLSYKYPLFMSANYTDTVSAMHSANISVYVGVFRNEFTNLLFDYSADPYVELATHSVQQVDGFITEYPATAVSYLSSPCHDKKNAYSMQAIQPGAMYQNFKDMTIEFAVAENPAVVETWAVPPAGAPPLSREEIVDPPLPPVSVVDAAQSSSPSAPPAPDAHQMVAAAAAASNKALVVVSSLLWSLCLLIVM